MWCPQCKIETTVAGSRSSAEARCGACGNPLQSSKGSDSTIRQARDIVAKWSSSDLLDQISALPALPPMPRPHFPKLSEAAPLRHQKPNSDQSEPEQSSQEHTAQQPDPHNAPPQEPESVDFVFDDDIEIDAVTSSESATNDTAQIDMKRHDADVAASKKAAVKSAATEIAAEKVAAVDADSDPVDKDQLAAHKPSAESQRATIEPRAAHTQNASNASGKTTTSRLKAHEASGAESSDQPTMTLIATLKPEAEQQVKQRPGDRATDVAANARQANLNQTVAVTSSDDEQSPAEARNSAPAPDPARRSQPRAGQPREPRERTSVSRRPAPDKNSKPAAALNEGQKTVTRNLRVDRPGPEDTEPPELSSGSNSNKNVAGARIQSNSSGGGRRRRIDSGESAEATLETGDSRVRTQQHPRRRYIDEPHDTAVRGPHFQVTAPKRSNITSLTGQFLAYLGVLGLTIGTAIVIYGHFGGYSDYTPTGWLVTTVAQMMLFLGVINLVSGGIEQTNDDVSARINTLGEQLLRIEQVTEEVLRGPKISSRRYANPDADATEHEHERELAPVRQRD